MASHVLIDHAWHPLMARTSPRDARGRVLSPDFFIKHWPWAPAKSDPTRPLISISTSTPQWNSCPQSGVGGVQARPHIPYRIAAAADLQLYATSVQCIFGNIIFVSTLGQYTVLQVEPDRTFFPWPGSHYLIVELYAGQGYSKLCSAPCIAASLILN